MIRHGEEEHQFTIGEVGSCLAPPRQEEPYPEEEVQFEDPPGRFCTTEAPQPDEPFVLSFVAGHCLSSSCTFNYDLWCTFTLNGHQIDASIEGGYGIHTHLDASECTDDCGVRSGPCTELTLPEGIYGIEYAGETFELAIPGEAESCL